MALYRYVNERDIRKKKLRVPRIIPFLFMGLGLMLLIWTVWPVMFFWFIEQNALVGIISPLTEETVKAASPFSPVVFASEGSTALKDVNQWFPGATQKKATGPISTYVLSIPKLKIDNATVTVAGDDLDDSLVHYGGTALPGQYGTTVIFGHSTLPQFYNPKNYKTIFSLLPTLKVGDEFSVVYDGITYAYVVYDITVIEPTDLSVLEQRFDDSYMTLVTCVPPGTLWKRLNVKARLKAS